MHWMRQISLSPVVVIPVIGFECPQSLPALLCIEPAAWQEVPHRLDAVFHREPRRHFEMDA
jgi:hypothetical protein